MGSLSTWVLHSIIKSPGQEHSNDRQDDAEMQEQVGSRQPTGREDLKRKVQKHQAMLQSWAAGLYGRPGIPRHGLRNSEILAFIQVLFDLFWSLFGGWFFVMENEGLEAGKQPPGDQAIHAHPAAPMLDKGHLALFVKERDELALLVGQFQLHRNIGLEQLVFNLPTRSLIPRPVRAEMATELAKSLKDERANSGS